MGKERRSRSYWTLPCGSEPGCGVDSDGSAPKIETSRRLGESRDRKFYGLPSRIQLDRRSWDVGPSTQLFQDRRARHEHRVQSRPRIWGAGCSAAKSAAAGKLHALLAYGNDSTLDRSARGGAAGRHSTERWGAAAF